MEAEMALLRLKYVMTDRDRSGTVRYFYRRHGKKIRLRGDVGSEEFMAAYAAAEKGGKQLPVNNKDPKSFDTLVNAYYRSVTFKNLNALSQRTRQNILEKFAKVHGAKPYAQMERRHVLKFRDDMADRPGAATNLIKALRHVFSYALDYELVKVNPARTVPYLRKGGTGFHSWTIDEVRQYETTHAIGTKARLAMALLLYTGQRRSDVVTFGKQMIRDGRLHYVQQKTKKRMATKMIGPLLAIIEATPKGGLTFLETHRGMPYTANGFGNAFREWSDEAGLHHCSAHGLRKALASRLAELGVSASHIQQTLGHETLSEASRYTKAADSEIGSDAALEIFENAIAPHVELRGANQQKNIRKSK